MTEPTKISAAQFFARSLAIEQEAIQRYADLAEQMETHNNPELADLFRKLETIEGKHAANIKARAGDIELPKVSPLAYRWPDNEPPEIVPHQDVHYLMTPHHALKLALEGEERAVAYFDELAKVAENEDVRALATEFADEEREHVRLMQDWLGKFPEPEQDWDEDLDPPAIQE